MIQALLRLYFLYTRHRDAPFLSEPKTTRGPKPGPGSQEEGSSRDRTVHVHRQTRAQARVCYTSAMSPRGSRKRSSADESPAVNSTTPESVEADGEPEQLPEGSAPSGSPARREDVEWAWI